MVEPAMNLPTPGRKCPGLFREGQMEAWAALIVSVATLITSVSAVVLAVRNSNKIQDVHLSINSRMDQLLSATGAAERAAGITQERNRKIEET